MMPHRSDDQLTTPASREAQIRRTWWQRAKDFILSILTNHTGDNARLQTPNHEINTDTKAVPAEDHPAPSRVLVDQGDAQAASNLQHPQVPGAKANTAYTNADNSPTALEIPYIPRSTAQIYFSDMLKPAVGYPVFMPTPSRGLPEAYRTHGIRVGDVGAITSNGAFDFMFNTCQYDDEPDEEINPDTLPEGFELLEQNVRVKEKFSPRAVFSGQNINEIQGRDRPTFQCVGHGGGVLALPTGAVAYEAVNKLDFQHHAARHAINWYKYMLDIGRDYPNGSLYFITECIKSKHWGIATFYGQKNPNNTVGVVFDDDHDDEESCRWEYRGKLETRVGPSETQGEPNQCVFLRGYRIMLRRDIWDRLMSAAMGFPYQDGESTHDISGTRSESFNDDGQLIRTHFLGDVILEEDISASALFHPSDSINAMLLNAKPEAKVAITHDSEWCDNLPPDFTANPFNPDIDGLLENIKRSHEVGIDHESAVLIK